ncbi:MAG: hypothetical protein HUK20_01100 [Fibrobacter sp.]|nr:hypothetical protein [Fibrobacter sp.]
MSQRLGLFASIFCAVAWAIDVDSLPVWDPSFLVTNNSFVRNADDTARNDSLETHGYKTVQVTVGDGGTQVDQELRLSIQGRVTDSVYVDALLSDVGRKAGDQTTATLREVDQVYFRVESPHLMLHLGDLTWRDETMGFYSLERSTLGAMAGVKGSFAGGDTQVRGVVGTDEVRHYSILLNGVSGQREGYSLDAGGNFVALVPNSETVWLNGQVLRRGVDYVVNYAGGMLDFRGAVFITFDDEIRVEYDAYENDDVFTLYGANASYHHPNLYLDLSGYRLENDTSQFKKNLMEGDTLKKPAMAERAGARIRFQKDQMFYGDFEISLNHKDSNMLSNMVETSTGKAFRWYITSDSTHNLKRFPLAVSIYGNRVQQGLDILESPGTDLDWNLYGLRDKWDLNYVDEKRLDDELLHDEFTLRMHLGANLYGRAVWGYRRNKSEKWNSSRAEFALTHQNSNVLSEIGIARVASILDDEKERYQANVTAEYLQGTFRPFGTMDLRYTEILTQEDSKKQLNDQIAYAKTSGGFGIYFGRSEIKETVGGRMAKRKGDHYTDAWQDSLKVATWQQEVNYTSRWLRLNHLLQYEKTVTDSLGQNDSWVGSADALYGGEELGIVGSTKYNLGLTQEQIYTAVYKPVAPGTGDVRYDSLTGSYIEGVDNGDFVYEGMGRNDSIGAVRASDVQFSTHIKIMPGLFFHVKRGILRDISFGGSYEGEGNDTTGKTLYFTPLTVSQLKRITTGKMLLEGFVEWKHPAGVSLLYKTATEFDKKMSSISYFETIRSHTIEAGFQVHPDHFLGSDLLIQNEELLSMQEWNWDVYDISVRYRFDFLDGFFVQPLGRYRSGSGNDDGGLEFDADLVEGALRLGYRKMQKTDIYGNFSIIEMNSRGDLLPYQVMSGYSKGRTYRFEFSTSVDLNKYLAIGCYYVIRFGDAEQNIFQKLSTQAKAYF